MAHDAEGLDSCQTNGGVGVKEGKATDDRVSVQPGGSQ